MDDALFVKAVTAAVIDEELAAAPVRATEAFSRAHVEQLRQAGCTKADARSYLESAFGGQRVKRGGRLANVVDLLVSDLDSYGPWAEED